MHMITENIMHYQSIKLYNLHKHNYACITYNLGTLFYQVWLKATVYVVICSVLL